MLHIKATIRWAKTSNKITNASSKKTIITWNKTSHKIILIDKVSSKKQEEEASQQVIK